MRKPHTLAIAVAVAAAGCSAAATNDRPAAAPAATEMVVLRQAGRVQLGDTVSVDLTDISDDGRVAYYDDGARSGTLPLDALGPAVPATMIVDADRLNVRRCRSRGCSVAGYVVRGQQVEVSDYADGWYRLTLDGEAAGYLFAELLRTPLAYGRAQFAVFQDRAAAYYQNRLAGLRVAGGEPAFSGYDVRLRDELLSFEFYTAFDEGAALPVLCDAMRGIARFVGDLMAGTPSTVFPAFSAGIYHVVPGASPDYDDMVAGLAGEGNTYCKRS
jgi:hypothetical protein